MKHFFYSLILLSMLSVASVYTVPTTFITPDQITTTPFSITAPGLYVLTDDVDYQTSGGTSITIDSSDVSLDLNGKAIINSNLPGIESAISLASTHTNITIKNGTLRVFDGDGVRVPAGSQDIVLEDLTVVGVNNDGTGFNFQGSFGAALRTTNVTIKNCFVSNCGFGLRTTAVDAGNISNSMFNRNGFGLFSDDSNSWRVENCQTSFNNNSGGSGGVGFEMRACFCWKIKNFDASHNITSASAAGGFFLNTTLGTSGGHVLEDCTFSNNTSTSGNIQGINMIQTHSCILKNCIANANSGRSSSTGFLLTGSSYVLQNCSASGNFSETNLTRGFSSTGTAHYYFNCTASSNVAGTPGTSSGLFLSGIGHIAEDCTFSGNFSPADFATGILCDATADCLIKNCTSTANAGSSAANSRGFVGSTAGADLWIGNVAFGQATNYFSTVIPFITVAATGPYPLAGSFDNRDLTNLSFD